MVNKRFFLLLLILLCLLPMNVHASNFCYEEALEKGMEPFFVAPENFYRPMSQGMCIADNTVIYTRYSNDSAKTTYVILNAETGEEITHQEFNTLHSNSLTYNPIERKVVCVTKGLAYIFSYQNQRLELIDTIRMNHNCPKIAYNVSDGYYYLGTSTKVFRTTDFHSLQEAFSVPQLGINQGMGCDGTYLYIPWYHVGDNAVCVYSTNGSLVKKYHLTSNEYREIEDIDFIGDQMYLNIQNSPGKNGIYSIRADHQYGEWKTETEPTCGRSGLKTSTCSRCGNEQYQEIAATGQHTKGKWEYEKKPTCTEEGFRVCKCSVCSLIVKEESVPALGHNFGDWKIIKEPDAMHEGKKTRKCSRCDKEEKESIDKLDPWIKYQYPYIPVVLEDGKVEFSYKLETGDYTVSEYSGNPDVILCEGDTLTPVKCGHTTITVETAAGAKESFEVDIISKEQPNKDFLGYNNSAVDLDEKKSIIQIK